MKIDVVLKIRTGTIFVNSEAANLAEERPLLIALSTIKGEDFEQVEAVGIKLTTQEMEDDSWFQERDKGNRIYRVVNPFIPQIFEPRAASLIIDFFCRKVFYSINPQRGDWRKLFGLDYFDLKLQIENYLTVPTDKKIEFEKLLSKVSRKFYIEF